PVILIPAASSVSAITVPVYIGGSWIVSWNGPGTASDACPASTTSFVPGFRPSCTSLRPPTQLFSTFTYRVFGLVTKPTCPPGGVEVIVKSRQLMLKSRPPTSATYQWSICLIGQCGCMNSSSNTLSSTITLRTEVMLSFLSRAAQSSNTVVLCQPTRLRYSLSPKLGSPSPMRIRSL